MSESIPIGIIGGSGLDNPRFFRELKTVSIKTPYGKTSSPLIVGRIKSTQVILLARHGVDHSLSPSNIPYQANIWALKSLGCAKIIATTACGSLQNKFKPGEIVFPDQFIDFTKNRKYTFFTDTVVHTPMAHPFSPSIRSALSKTAKALKLPFHDMGTILTIEGPRFSSQAESRMFRSWGADLINMSTVPEVVLANELKIQYQTVAMVTDYDSWRNTDEPVSFDLILERMKENADRVLLLLKDAISVGI